jgi:hypothetical protein
VSHGISGSRRAVDSRPGERADQVRDLARLLTLVPDVVAVQPGWQRAGVDDLPAARAQAGRAPERAAAELSDNQGHVITAVLLQRVRELVRVGRLAVQVDAHDVEQAPVDAFRGH